MSTRRSTFRKRKVHDRRHTVYTGRPLRELLKFVFPAGAEFWFCPTMKGIVKVY